MTVLGNVLSDAVKYVFGRTLGLLSSPETPELQRIERERPGDLDALMDATEPSLRLGHTVVGQGASNIIIINGDNNVVHFNESTKAYVNNSTLLEEYEMLDASVASLNANTGYGRVFIDNLGKTVPFTIDSLAARGTKGSLSRSLDKYANSLPSFVNIKFKRIVAPDGRTKKIVIYSATLVDE